MRRRELLLLLSGAMTVPHALCAQQKAMPVIGFLGLSSPVPFAPNVAAFHRGLGEAGYVEGGNVAVEYRWAEEHYDRLPALAADLVARRVDVIVTQGGSPSALAAKNATTTIPIVFMAGGADPVASGLVASLARPSGNLTGFTLIHIDVMAKRLELLCELVPEAKVIGLLVRPDYPETEGQVRQVREAARAKRIELQIVNASDEGEIDTAFVTLAQVKAGALLVGSVPFFFSRRHQIVALAARYAVPAMYDSREYGGLISYASSGTDIWGQLGIYTARILKGEKPADLPVQQPTRLELVINLNTAKGLGLTIPPSILARADEVIE